MTSLSRRARPLPDPDACFWCDLPKLGHARQQFSGGGSHLYTPPTDRMRLARMTARRNARSNP
jgi:hypothetical protein